MSGQKTQAVLASLVELRGELAELLEAKIDAESRETALVDVLAKVRAHPSIARADALIEQLSTQ